MKPLIGKIHSFLKNQEFQKYFFNTSWLMVNQFAKLIVGLFIGIWVTRYLGPEKFGILSYVLSFSLLFKTFSSLGLNNIVVRDLVKRPDDSNLLMGTTYRLKIFGSLASILVLVLILLLWQNLTLEIKLYIFIIVLGTAFTSLSVIDFFFQSKVLSKYSVFAGLFSVILSSIIKVALILSGAPLFAFVCVFFFDGLSLGIGYIYFYRKLGGRLTKWQFSRPLAKSLLKESWPLILSGLAISLGMRIDQIMLREFVAMEKLGLYAVGVRLAEVFSFLPLIISQSIFPKIVSLDLSKDKDKLISIFRYVFLVLCLLAIGVTLVAKFTVLTLYGSEFLYSYEVLQILIWTIPVTYLGILSNRLLIITKHQKIVFWKQLVLVVLNIGLNLILMPKYGIIGAAWATLIADITVNFFLDIFFAQTKWIFALKIKALLPIPASK